MLQNWMYITRPIGRFGLQLLRKQVPAFSCNAPQRWFSDKVTPEPSAATETPEEEIAEPLAHNKFKHPGAIMFEHSKDNEPANVKDDDWFAIVQLSGTQYKLGKDDLLFTNKMKYDIGQQVILNNVLLLGSKHKTIVGHPLIENAKVLCTVEQQIKEKKVTVFKFQKRERFSKKQGFRRQLTALRVDEIIF